MVTNHVAKSGGNQPKISKTWKKWGKYYLKEIFVSKHLWPGIEVTFDKILFDNTLKKSLSNWRGSFRITILTATMCWKYVIWTMWTYIFSSTKTVGKTVIRCRKCEKGEFLPSKWVGTLFTWPMTYYQIKYNLNGTRLIKTRYLHLWYTYIDVVRSVFGCCSPLHNLLQRTMTFT